MIEDWAELAFAASFLLLAIGFWFTAHRHWRAAAGALLALASSAPTTRLAMAHQFRLSAVLIFAAGSLAGIALASSDKR